VWAFLLAGELLLGTPNRALAETDRPDAPAAKRKAKAGQSKAKSKRDKDASKKDRKRKNAGVSKRKQKAPQRSARTSINPATRQRAVDLRREDSDTPSTPPSSIEKLGEQINQVCAGRELLPGTTAVYLVDAASGQPLFSLHADARLNPASNVKLVSTATVLDVLGPEWRFVTRVYGLPPDQGGVSRGDVYLRGQSDPTLSQSRLRELARAVAASGVKRIAGDLLIGDSPTRDALGSSALKVTVRGAGKKGKAPLVELSPRSDFVHLVVKAKTAGGKRSRLSVQSRVDMDEDHPRLVVTVTGRAARGRVSSFFTSARKPSTFTAYTLRAALRDAGVEMAGKVRVADFVSFAGKTTAGGDLIVELGRTQSKTVAEIIARINKPSNNFLADRMVMVAGAAAFGGEPSMAKGVQAMHRFLASAGIDPEALYLDTGSGLSYATKLSPKQIVQLLRVAAGYQQRQGEVEPNSEAFLQSLSIAGVDGTLRGRFHNMGNGARLVCKTGTLTHIIALSGFFEVAVRTLAFSIVSNVIRHKFGVRSAHEQIVLAMIDYMAHTSAAESGASALPGFVGSRAAGATPGYEDFEITEAGGGEEDGTDVGEEEGAGDFAPERDAPTPIAPRMH
jgi:D-alanyl-D-alanine carboxypeptidase/D-alanyl-D-alanine-endopeptidase (penicillin-binding protein 4)